MEASRSSLLSWSRCPLFVICDIPQAKCMHMDAGLPLPHRRQYPGGSDDNGRYRRRRRPSPGRSHDPVQHRVLVSRNRSRRDMSTEGAIATLDSPTDDMELSYTKSSKSTWNQNEQPDSEQVIKSRPHTPYSTGAVTCTQPHPYDIGILNCTFVYRYLT
jgi:hypothetical protein